MSGGGEVGQWRVPMASPRFSPGADVHLLTGTAATLAARLDLEPIAVRLGFLALFVAGGWGLALYAGAWVAT